jgi:hypothetical protein
MFHQRRFPLPVGCSDLLAWAELQRPPAVSIAFHLRQLAIQLDNLLKEIGRTVTSCVGLCPMVRCEGVEPSLKEQ